jgi:hypothetical protein
MVVVKRDIFVHNPHHIVKSFESLLTNFNTLALEMSKEIFDHGIVPAIALSTHALDNMMGFQQIHIGAVGVMDPLVAVNERSGKIAFTRQLLHRFAG